MFVDVEERSDDHPQTKTKKRQAMVACLLGKYLFVQCSIGCRLQECCPCRCRKGSRLPYPR